MDRLRGHIQTLDLDQWRQQVYDEVSAAKVSDLGPESFEDQELNNGRFKRGAEHDCHCTGLPGPPGPPGKRQSFHLKLEQN